MAETFPRLTPWSESIGVTWQTHQGSSGSPADRIASLTEPRLGTDMRVAPHSKAKLILMLGRGPDIFL